MFYSLGRLLVFCFRMVSSCFQLFATFGCSPHHHQDYQQHNNNNINNNNNNPNFRNNNNNHNLNNNVNSHKINHSNHHHQHRTSVSHHNHSNHQLSVTNSKQTTNIYRNHGNHHSKTFHKSNHLRPTISGSGGVVVGGASSGSSVNHGTIISTNTNATNNNNKKMMALELNRPIIPFHMCLINYFCHGTLFFFGHLADFLRRINVIESYEMVEKNRVGYPPLYQSFATFYVRNIIQRLINMWGHPIVFCPSAYTTILSRKFGPYNGKWEFTGETIRAINMGSYDYLGHSQNTGPRIDSVLEVIQKSGVAISSTLNELGSTQLYVELEKKVAKFLGVEDSIIIGMGFATNALSLPSLFGPGSLVISDQCNHASLALGCKISGAKICVFKHNDMIDLEQVIRSNLIRGQPNTGEKWRKIIIIVEGIYSMEGTIVNLPEVIRIKKKYKAYLYMDEAHSIGAMGLKGRGICDYYGCDPRDVDILMGTFTKSFAAAGGYIAGSKRIINYIRANSASFYYGTSMSPPIIQQIMWTLNEFLEITNISNNYDCDEEVQQSVPMKPIQQRINQLIRNVKRFRQKLRELGFHVDGNDDSPVVPILVYTPSNLKCLIKKLLDKGVASTGATYPVTSLTGIRARFCLSAGHTDQMIDYTLQCLDEIGSEISIKFDQKKQQTLRSNENNQRIMMMVDQSSQMMINKNQITTNRNDSKFSTCQESSQSQMFSIRLNNNNNTNINYHYLLEPGSKLLPQNGFVSTTATTVVS